MIGIIVILSLLLLFFIVGFIVLGSRGDYYYDLYLKQCTETSTQHSQLIALRAQHAEVVNKLKRIEEILHGNS